MIDDWRVGLLAGYGHSDFSVDDRDSKGTADSFTFGAYGSRSWDSLNMRGALAYGWHDLSIERTARAGSFSDRLSSDYGVSALQAFGEIGYELQTGIANFEPFVGVANVSVFGNGYDEHGGAAALSSGWQASNTTFATLGLRMQRDIEVGGIVARMHGMIGWQNAFGDTTLAARHTFAGGNNFTVYGPDLAGSGLDGAALIDTGFDLDIDANTTLGVTYSGHFSQATAEHALKANLTIRF